MTARGTFTGPEDGTPAIAERLKVELAEMWREVLGAGDAPGDEVDFTELGGNSLQAARIAARTRKSYGVDLTVGELFDAGTVAALARLLAARGDGRRAADRGAPLPPVTRHPEDEPVVSPGQQRLWFLDQLSTTAGISYNVPAVTRFRGPLVLAALRDAWADVVRGHEQLRSTFELVDGAARARREREVPPTVNCVDLGDCRDPLGEAIRRAARLAAEHIDLATAPLLRCAVFRLDDDDHVMVAVLPHIVADGRTLDIIDRDLGQAYRARRNAEAWSPESPPLDYGDFARWQQQLAAGPELTGLLDHWRRYLAGAATALELPADYPRPATRSHLGGRVTQRTNGGLLTDVREFAAATRTTPYTVCLSAYAALLGELTGERDLLIATPMDGRPDAGLEDVVGFFANTVPVRLRPDGRSFRELVREAHAEMLRALEHQYVPFERLAAELAPARDLSRAPLAQVALAYQGRRRPHADLPGLAAETMAVDNSTAKFDLTLEIHEDGTELEVCAEYSADLFTRQRGLQMLERYLRLLRITVARPDLPPCEESDPRPSELPVTANAVSVPQTDTTVRRDRCLHEVFAETAARHSDSVAVTDGDRALTYAQLDRTANRLAHRLKAYGAGPEQLVGLCAERTVDLVVGVLAILKAGAGYLPLDSRHPPARLTDTLDDADCRLLVGDAELCRPLLGSTRGLVCLDEPLADEPDVALRTKVAPDNVAYVIYTSGSTGKPKGTVVTHTNVTRLFTATADDFRFGPDDVWTLFHSIAFDFSVWELWGPLLNGGRLVIVPYGTSRDPFSFLNFLRTQRVTVLNQTPTAFRELAAAAEDDGFPPLDLRVVIFGGESLNPAVLRSWVEAYGTTRPRLVNMYGITETTVHVTIRPLGLADLMSSTSPIGRPLSDLRVHLLDEHMNEAPPGAEGEMYVGGAGVAREYLNRPDLTEERFVHDPFGAPGERLYRSGDLAVRLRSGELEYRGRADQQVKLHGFRIELGEIEEALLDQPAVRSAACVLREDTPGLPRLVGYLVPASGERLRVEEVREALEQRLPTHMVPAALVRLSGLPLTDNGKLDRTRLPTPEAERHSAEEQSQRITARTTTEHALTEAWRQIFGVAKPSVHENFFAAGGDSIGAIRMSALARANGLPVTVESIFLHPTIAELSSHCDQPESVWQRGAPGAGPRLSTLLGDLDPALLPPDVTDAYPTAAMQLAILFECEYSEDETWGLYHDLIGVRLDGPFDPAALDRALHTMSQRHEILRTSFRLGSFREPMQLVHRETRVPVTVDDRTEPDQGLGNREELDEGARERLLRQWWIAEKADPFDLARPPMLRCHVLRADTRGFHLSLAVHHVILDGWSFARLMTELLLEYDAQLAGGGASLPSTPTPPYRDFIAAEQAAIADPVVEEFWQTLLRSTAAVPVPILSGDPAEDEFAFHTVLPPTLDAELNRVAGDLGLPAKSVFLAAHAWALACLTTRTDTTVGVQVNGRLEQEGADLALGLFLNMVPVHITVGGETWAELSRAAFAAERDRQPYRHYPLASMQQLVGREHDLFKVTFNYTDFHAFDALDSLTWIRTGDWWFADRHSFPLMLEITRQPRSGRRVLAVTVGVDSPLTCSGTRLGELTLRALRSMATNPHAPSPPVGGNSG